MAHLPWPAGPKLVLPTPRGRGLLSRSQAPGEGEPCGCGWPCPLTESGLTLSFHKKLVEAQEQGHLVRLGQFLQTPSLCSPRKKWRKEK